jgi:hypothetical protein
MEQGLNSPGLNMEHTWKIRTGLAYSLKYEKTRLMTELEPDLGESD